VTLVFLDPFRRQAGWAGPSVALDGRFEVRNADWRGGHW
jgi:hypothetical protein